MAAKVAAAMAAQLADCLVCGWALGTAGQLAGDLVEGRVALSGATMVALMVAAWVLERAEHLAAGKAEPLDEREAGEMAVTMAFAVVA